MGGWSEPAGFQNMPREQDKCTKLVLGVWTGRSPFPPRELNEANGRPHSQPDTEGSGVVGNGCHLWIFWLKTLHKVCQFQTSPCSWVSLFSFCAPLYVSRHNYSGRCSPNGHGLQFFSLITVWEARGEGGRERRNPNLRKG